LLDEQFNTNSDYAEFVNKNYIAMRFTLKDKGGPEMFELFDVQSTPTIVFAEADGKEIDRITGYANPPESFLYNMTGITYLHQGRIEDALRIYGQDYIARKDIKSSELIKYIAFWLGRDINQESALKTVSKYKEMTKGTITSLRNLSSIYAKLDNMDEALKYYGSDYIKNHMTNASVLNSYAWFWALEGKNLEHALEISKKSIELRSNQFNWDTLSMVYWKMGKYKEAIEAEEKALEFAPGTERYLKRIEDIKKDIKKKGEK